MKTSTEEYLLGGIAAFLIAAIFMFGGGGGGGKTAEQLGEMVFKAVKAKDMDAAKKIMVNNDDMLFMIDESSFPADAKEEARKKLKENEQRMSDEFDRYWDLLIVRLESAKIDLAQMKMGTIVVEEQMAGGSMSKSLKGARIQVPFTAGDKSGTLAFAGFEHKRWRLVPPIALKEDFDAPTHEGHHEGHGHGH